MKYVFDKRGILTSLHYLWWDAIRPRCLAVRESRWLSAVRQLMAGHPAGSTAEGDSVLCAVESFVVLDPSVKLFVFVADKHACE